MDSQSKPSSVISTIPVESPKKRAVINETSFLGISKHPYLWTLFLGIMAVMYGSYGVLVHASEVDGKLPFNTAAVAFLIEFFKLGITILLYFIVTFRAVRKENSSGVIRSAFTAIGQVGMQLARIRASALFLLPAMLYTVNNNLAQYLQLEMDPATYQVLSNLKIVTTTVLYRIIIRKSISTAHYVALSILTIASVLNTVGGFSYKHDPTHLSTDVSRGKGANLESESLRIHITLLGLVLLLVYSTISGLGGVCSEYVLKKNSSLSLHLQNAYLYFYGVLFNMIVFYAQSSATSITDSNSSSLESVSLSQFSFASFIRGFSVTTWILIATQSCVGLMMSAVMKFSSNITRLFVIGSAMMCSTVLSVAFFALELNACFCAAFLLAFVALFLYQTDGQCCQ